MTSLHDELEKKLQESNATPMSLPLQFLKAITCDFSTESELGRGGYGVVYKGVLRSGKIIAVKKLFEIHLVDDKTFQNEVGSLMEFKHQHVVQFIGYCAESSWETIKQPSGNFIWAEIPKRLLCFEYLCNQSLDKYISVPTDESLVFEWNTRYEIIKGICNGLKFLHEECRMVHLDLKPENILMDATMMPKIADFGLSRIFGSQQSRILTNNSAGSRGYMAPEYLIQGIITMKADIFSLGVMIIEIITGRRDYPYFQLDSPESNSSSCQHFIKEVLGSWRYKFESTLKSWSIEKYNQQVKQCITIALKCVDPVMEKRPTANDVIQVLTAVEQMESHEELLLDMQCKDKFLCPKFIASNNLAAQNVPGEMFINKTYGEVVDQAKSAESLSPMPTVSMSIVGNQNYQERAQEFSEPQSAHDTTIETEAIPGSSALLDVHPLELRFSFEPNKLIACSLDLTNNTNEKVAFMLLRKCNMQKCFLRKLPMLGFVHPFTTCTLVVVMDERKNLPQERNVDLILQTSTYYGILSDGDKCIQHFRNAEELGNTVHKLTLKGVCALQGETIFQQSIPPSIQFISTGDNIFCMDTNQIEPLIITSGFSMNLLIWNYDTQKYMGFVKLSDPAYSVKFIARKEWFLVGTRGGFIHVFNYRNEMQQITSIKVDSRDSVVALAVHPTRPYVLSACRMEIKLWDWDRRSTWLGWKCKRTYDLSSIVYAVAFNPEDDNSFATGSLNGAVQVWSMYSTNCMYSLSGHSSAVVSLDFFTRDCQQYLISGSRDKTAKIWDMQKKECVRTLSHRSEVSSILPHPTLPLLVTGTQDGTVYLWSSTNFRLNRTLHVGRPSAVVGLACLIESGRIAVLHLAHGVSMIEIRDEDGQGGSNDNDESSISVTY